MARDTCPAHTAIWQRRTIPAMRLQVAGGENQRPHPQRRGPLHQRERHPGLIRACAVVVRPDARLRDQRHGQGDDVAMH